LQENADKENVMTTIIFYEKPGCANNTRQKRLLAEAGHEVMPRNLLTEPWTADQLRGFFGNMPVAQWFNRAAPRVKSGEIDPDHMDPLAAIDLMLADPLLIRRPLMESEGRRMAGFDPDLVHQWLGLPGPKDDEDLQTCRRSQAATPCPNPEESRHG
jgi:nitrogenase-associated protein